MAESMLAILCHILRGEPVIQERLGKEREGTVRPEEEGAPAGPPAPTGPLELLQQPERAPLHLGQPQLHQQPVQLMTPPTPLLVGSPRSTRHSSHR